LLHLVGHLYYSPTLMMHGQTQIKKKPAAADDDDVRLFGTV
jgi:hypothetical protein